MIQKEFREAVMWGGIRKAKAHLQWNLARDVKTRRRSSIGTSAEGRRPGGANS